MNKRVTNKNENKDISENSARQIANEFAIRIETKKLKWRPDITNSKIKSYNVDKWEVFYPPMWEDKIERLGGGFVLYIDKKNGNIKGPVWNQ